MKITINKSRLSGSVVAPPSKSVSHRYLICAALAEGESVIENLGVSEDILATADCLRALGADITTENGKTTVRGFGRTPDPRGILGCRESGSTLRFLIPVSMLSGRTVEFSGSARLIERGVEVYSSVLEKCGAEINFGKNRISVHGKLISGKYEIPGYISSQYISGMLFALPLLESDSIIGIIPPLESGSYLDITLDALKNFGVVTERPDRYTYVIRGGQHYTPCKVRVEGDYSNAAFLYALGAVGGNIRVEGLDPSSIQGDRVCISMIEKLAEGCPALDLSDCPDLAPVLFATAAVFNGAHFSGTKRLAIKESNRAIAMAKELAKFGIEVRVGENTVDVLPGSLRTPALPLLGHNDHRIVMALCVPAILTGAVIEGCEAINKSYPDFFKTLEVLGAEVSYGT